MPSRRVLWTDIKGEVGIFFPGWKAPNEGNKISLWHWFWERFVTGITESFSTLHTRSCTKTPCVHPWRMQVLEQASKTRAAPPRGVQELWSFFQALDRLKSTVFKLHSDSSKESRTSKILSILLLDSVESSWAYKRWWQGVSYHVSWKGPRP
jgi:hypothetical protein